MGFARLYARLRVGRIFLIILCMFCTVWVSWNSIPGLPHFDDAGFSRLTLILSVEASIATSVLMAANEKQDDLQRQQLIFLLHLMEGVHAQLTSPSCAVRGPSASGAAPGGDAPGASRQPEASAR